eukprot:CAMPEP_0201557034 /NCGR_PEP_ID=MMETSP0173_2-20130828/59198_1 /ASSEMBLY_ACC=CAM_ASM_000268 /TAXON_ID=218659 /ORGANISM="Vexillifera sp., Strain DIVA3 564/2" /LENGTH=68 /DNA_ID=CAMNT_0047969659 /DNA_START=170 /DNA_END=372 /DNA_ORIENTATION=-
MAKISNDDDSVVVLLQTNQPTVYIEEYELALAKATSNLKINQDIWEHNQSELDAFMRDLPDGQEKRQR